MAQLTDLEKVRRRRAKRRMLRNLLLLAVFSAVIYIGMTAIRRAGELDLATAYSDIKAEIISGTGYPVTLPGGKISRFESISDTLVLLSDTNIYTYNSSGKQLLNLQHGMGNQAIATARDRILLYDRGGTKLTTLSKSAQVNVMSTAYTIFDADLANDGSFVVVTGSGEYPAEVVVYNKNMEEIFKWYSEKPVICAALSNARGAMAVGRVDVSGGYYQSSISKFQFSIDKEMSRVDLPDELLLSLDYDSGNKLCAVTDKRMILLNSDLKEIASYEYEKKLDRFAVRPDGTRVLVMGNYTEDKQLTIVTLDDNMAVSGKFTVDYDVLDIEADNQFIYLATRSGIEVLQADGVAVLSVPVDNLHSVEPIGGVLYYTTTSKIDFLDIKALTEPQTGSSADASSKKLSIGKKSSSEEASSAPESSGEAVSSEATSGEPQE